MTRIKENLDKPAKPKSKTKFDNLSNALKENLQRRKKNQQATSVKNIEDAGEVTTS